MRLEHDPEHPVGDASITRSPDLCRRGDPSSKLCSVGAVCETELAASWPHAKMKDGARTRTKHNDNAHLEHVEDNER